jgi:hypothetical protein
MSLTSLLRAGRGPVWDWFEATFPETQRVCTSANRVLRAGGTKEPCTVPPVPGADHSLVGTSVGRRPRANSRNRRRTPPRAPTTTRGDLGERNRAPRCRAHRKARSISAATGRRAVARALPNGRDPRSLRAVFPRRTDRLAPPRRATEQTPR